MCDASRTGQRRRERPMMEVESVDALRAHIGRPLGTSEWVVVDQAMIDRFAEATGDHQWIHVDVERAKREMPGGKTIAHGYLTLSLLPKLNQGIFRVTKDRKSTRLNSSHANISYAVFCLKKNSNVFAHQPFL